MTPAGPGVTAPDRAAAHSPLRTGGRTVTTGWFEAEIYRLHLQNGNTEMKNLL